MDIFESLSGLEDFAAEQARALDRLVFQPQSTKRDKRIEDAAEVKRSPLQFRSLLEIADGGSRVRCRSQFERHVLLVEPGRIRREIPIGADAAGCEVYEGSLRSASLLWEGEFDLVWANDVPPIESSYERKRRWEALAKLPTSGGYLLRRERLREAQGLAWPILRGGLDSWGHVVCERMPRSDGTVLIMTQASARGHGRRAA